MFDNIKADLNEISFYLWIAIIATIFSIYSVKYNPSFINIGFVTFAYGIVGHIVFKTFDNIGLKGKKQVVIRIILEIITVSAWLYFTVKLLQ